MKLKLLSIFLLFLLVGKAQSYRDIADSLGLGFISQTITAQGSGVSFVDFNNDGWDDITVGSGFGDSLKFISNTNGVLTYIKSPITLNNENQQIIWVDYDNDGDRDLYLAFNLTYNRLYRQDSGFTFVDVTSSSGLSLSPKETYGAAWADINKDGWLDLYEGNQPNIGNGHNVLYLSNGNGTFTDATSLAGVGNGPLYTFIPAFLDINNNGWPDLFVTNDRIEYQALYKNNGDSVFTDISDSAKVKVKINGMGVATGDYDNDGYLDIYLTNTIEGNLLFRNLGNEKFEEVADTMKVTFNEETWGDLFLDYDLDGDLDLYVSSAFHTSANKSATLYRNDDTLFSEPFAGFVGDTSKSYSSASGDLNNDGFTDIVVPNQFPYKLQIWESNAGSYNRWVRIALEGTVSNRDAVGTWLRVYTGGKQQVRYTMCGESYLGQNSFIQNVGLGQSMVIDSLIITWPNGFIETHYNLNTNTLHKFVEGETLPKPVISNNGPLYFCKGDSINTLLTVNLTSSKIVWNNGDTTQVISPDTVGVYYAVVTNEIGIIDTTNFIKLERSNLALIGTSSPDTTGTGTGSTQVKVLNGLSPITYLWDDPMSQTTATATGLSPGTYKVIVEDSLCTDSLEVIISTVFSVEELSNTRVQVFPNPASKVLVLKTKYNKGTVRILDVKGVLVDTFLLESLTESKIDVSSYAEGLYFLELQYENAVSKTKFIVNK